MRTNTTGSSKRVSVTSSICSSRCANRSCCRPTTSRILRTQNVPHTYLARTPSVLALAQIDDLTDEADPVNVPATSDEHPNWRRRLSMTLAELEARPRFVDITEYFRAERGPSRPASDGGDV